MNFVITTIGGGEFLYDIINGIVLTINSTEYKALLHGIAIVGLLFHVFKTATVGTYNEAIKWAFMCYFVFAVAMIPKTTVIIEDRVNNGVPNIINNVPIGLAFPASLISNLDTALAEMFDTNFSPIGDISYTKSGMLFGNGIIDAMTKVQISSEVETNMTEFVRQCVYDQMMLENILKDTVKQSANLYNVILNPDKHSNILHVNYNKTTGGNTISTIIPCKQAANNLKSDLDNTINKTSLKVAQLLNPAIFSYSPSQALSKTDSQITDVNDYLLSSSKSALETIKQGVLMQVFIDGMDKRKSLASSDNPYAKAKARLTQREGWKVIGANAPTYLVIVKIFLQSMLYALFPIVIVMIISGIFGFAILTEYFKALFALCLISPMLAILNRISYGFTSYKLKHIVNESTNPLEQGMNLGNIIQIQEFNADIMAFSGYLSIMLIPLAFTITQRGFSAFGNAIGGAMQQSSISNSTATANEVVSGNYNLGNTSIGNDNLFNSSKFNVNDNNISKNNTNNNNETIGNRSSNNLQQDTSSINTHSKDVSSQNIHNANKIDTSSAMVKGGTDTLTEKGIGTFTFGSDNKLASMQQERTSLENSVSSSQGIMNSDGDRIDKGYGGQIGISIGVGSNGNVAGKGNFGGSEQNESKNIIMKGVDKVANMIGVSAGGSMHYNQNYSTETMSSNGTQMTNDQAFAKETIEHLNNKYDKNYMKNNMEKVFKEANDFQANLMKGRVENPNVESKSHNISNELDEFEKSLKNKK